MVWSYYLLSYKNYSKTQWFKNPLLSWICMVVYTLIPAERQISVSSKLFYIVSFRTAKTCSDPVSKNQTNDE